MSRTKKVRRRKFKNKSIDELVQLLKRMNKREDNLIQHIRDLEFYIDTLEDDFFEDNDVTFHSEELDTLLDELDDPIQEVEKQKLFSMKEVLAELNPPKKKKNKKKK